jgi:hypothetical protein
VEFMNRRSLGDLLIVWNKWYNHLTFDSFRVTRVTLRHCHLSKYKYLEPKWSLGSIKNNKITWKLQTRFDCVCTWRIMKNCNIPHAALAPAELYFSTGWALLNSQHWIVLDSMIPKDKKKLTTLKWRTG